MLKLGFRRTILLFAIVLTAACTSILGTFDVSNLSPIGGDGSAEASIADGGNELDAMASDAADAATPPLACTSWKYPAPIVVEDLSTQGRRTFGAAPHFQVMAARVSNKVVSSPGRIVVGKLGATAFTVYTVDVDSQGVTSFDTPAMTSNEGGLPSSTTIAVRHATITPTDNVTAVIGNEATAIVGASADYSAWLLHEEDAAVAPSPFVTFEGGAGTKLDAIANLPFADNEVFVAVTSSNVIGVANYTLGVGRATAGARATLDTVATSTNASDNLVPRLLHAYGNVYVFAHEATGSTLTWTIPESAVVPSPPPSRTIGTGAVSDIATSSVNAAITNVFFVETTLTGNLFFRYRAGTLTQAALDTWVSKDIPIARLYDNGTPDPNGDNATSKNATGANSAQWADDQLLTMGHHIAPDGGASNGINFLWLDAHSAVRGEQVGQNALLQDRTDPILAIEGYPVSVSASQATWNIAWVESKNDGTGNYHVLYMNQLTCK